MQSARWCGSADREAMAGDTAAGLPGWVGMNFPLAIWPVGQVHDDGPDQPGCLRSAQVRYRQAILLPPSASTANLRHTHHRQQYCRGAAAYRRLRGMPETALYPAVKRFLESAGFCVKGEVHGCDAVAVRDGEKLRLAIVEMKLGFNLDLVLQAMDRMRMADEVWLAVPATRRGRDRDPRVHRLCRAIGFGLMAINVARDRVEVLAEPGPYRPRPDTRRRARLLSEHARRRGDPSPGGSARQPIMTAYRQQALACAEALRSGPRRPRDVRAVAPDAGRILLRNVYDWFERTERGVYRLTRLGEAALQRWLGVASPPSGALTNRSDRPPPNHPSDRS
jgi:hypothetical protein